MKNVIVLNNPTDNSTVTLTQTEPDGGVTVETSPPDGGDMQNLIDIHYELNDIGDGYYPMRITHYAAIVEHYGYVITEYDVTPEEIITEDGVVY